MAKQTATQVIGIASGKGGVGKTTTSVNLAVALAELNKRVMLFDADLGLANAQLLLGCRAPFNLSHVLSGQKQLKEIIIEGPSGVQLVPAASGLQHMAALNETQTASIINAFSEIDEHIDYLILDMGAGIADMVMTFLQACQHRFIVLKNEPSSIADAYGIVKVMIKEHQLNNIGLIPNCVKSQAEGERLYGNINSVIGNFLGDHVDYIHSIREDEMVLRAIKASQPVITHSPYTAASKDYMALAKQVISRSTEPKMSGGMQFFFERMVASAKVAGKAS
jgi:flagellar biosynthesis protein FlhG